MKTQPIEPASPAVDAEGVPFSPAWGDRYRPSIGAAAQARHVFLAGNGLPERWRGRRSFTVLETGFGLGGNFLATLDAWRADGERCERLDFVSIEKHPPQAEALVRLHEATPLAALSRELAGVWPPLTHNLHTLRFDGGRVRLLLALGDVADWLPEIVARVDAFYLDGFAPDRNPQMWTPAVFRALGRLAAPLATAATWTAARAVRDAMRAAGFEVRGTPGIGGKRDITLATYAPRFAPRMPPSRGRVVEGSAGRHAVIVGAGLAGCACAWALAERGWTSRIVDRLPAPALAASGNAAALFHGAVNAHDGTHARFNRAAALRVVEAVRTARLEFGAAGAQDGLLRLETRRDSEGMRSMLRTLGLPPDYLQALDAHAAARIAGLPPGAPAWFYPQGGWVDPRALALAFLARAGGAARFEGGVDVAGLEQAAGPHGTSPAVWRVIDGDGRVRAEAPVVVLAGGCQVTSLAPGGAAAWLLAPVRGQATLLDAGAPGLRLPAVPVSGAGYVLPALPDGRALCGASSDAGDASNEVRARDDAQNLARLAALTGSLPRVGAHDLQGWAAVRCVAADRLPLVGGVPDAEALPAAAGGHEQPRRVPRLPGLHVFSALASRGVVWSALGAEIVAALVDGAACPVEASLLDAVDAARFVSRRARRG